MAIQGHDDKEYNSTPKNLPDQLQYADVPTAPIRNVQVPPHYCHTPITSAKYVAMSSNPTIYKGKETATISHLNQTILPSATAEREENVLVVCEQPSIPFMLERNVPPQYPTSYSSDLYASRKGKGKSTGKRRQVW